MQTFIGSPALSRFRQEKLLALVQAQVPEVKELNAHFVHFADTDAALSSDDTEVLEKLLRYGPHMDEVSSEGRLFLVVPRTGTISPWSSKATDIAHNCNLAAVNRLERGIAYHVCCADGFEWSDESISIVAACWHDRMIEMVIDSN